MSDLPETNQSETSEAEATRPDTSTEDPTRTEDGGTALEQAGEAIREAKDAGGTVAANEDITTLDAQRAGEYSEDPGGEGGHP
ncbi:hypothetical protein GCM10022197_20290 [Microlunatus spumicola]|uniref:MT0933-like antitoxin protein n=1 Tax=Microlunatus spumicola TaxID=81499 RepID=A0ABP6XC99_9ACTN